jgi:hypothetical protein
MEQGSLRPATAFSAFISRCVHRSVLRMCLLETWAGAHATMLCTLHARSKREVGPNRWPEVGAAQARAPQNRASPLPTADGSALDARLPVGERGAVMGGRGVLPSLAILPSHHSPGPRLRDHAAPPRHRQPHHPPATPRAGQHAWHALAQGAAGCAAAARLGPRPAHAHPCCARPAHARRTAGQQGWLGALQGRRSCKAGQ